MPKQILLVEDELILCENYAKTIREHGYAVITCHSKQGALQIINKRLPDLAILDIGLGDEMEAGFDLCREIRSLSAVLPIIFLTARDSDVDTVSGLRLGADDYLSKDTSINNLLARIAALFRRIHALESNDDTEKIKRGKLTVDTSRFRVEWGEDAIDLSLTEFWIVHSLAKRIDHVKSKDQLMQDSKQVVADNTITSHLKRIRKKFKESDKNFDQIETVYGVGYRWRS
jgi:two-component system OmpR family response regulator|tara:strand:- start:1182 stop:1868 length:687 start_codon:yes stop_codon:yes gene_type:complete